MSFHRNAGRSLTIFAAWATLSFSVSLVACSEGTDDEPEGAAGSGNEGGSQESGSGGSATGGSSQGDAGSEQGQGEGGTPSTATGGSAGSTPGAAAGAAGEGTTGPEVLFAFDEGMEGFKFETYQPTDTTQPFNLYETSTLSWDDTKGKPDPGSLKVEIPFDAYNQQATVQFNYDAEGPQDFSGKTLTVRVMLDSGFNPDPSFPGGVQFFVKTGEAWTFGEAGWTNVELVGTWVEYSFPLESAVTYPAAGTVSDFDPSQVRAIGVSFNTGGGAQEGAATQPIGPPTEATFFVDTFILQ